MVNGYIILVVLSSNLHQVIYVLILVQIIKDQRSMALFGIIYMWA